MKRKADGHKSGVEIVTVVLCLVLLGLFASRKEGYHMDELLSFELADAEYNPWIVPTQPVGRLAKFVHNEIEGDSLGETFHNLAATVVDVVKNRGNSRLLTYKADVYEEPVWITGEQFRDYITVGRGDAFHYLSVYFNVKDDNHPPLHFMLLHTVSSFFPGKISPWMGCAVNLAAAAAILILLLKLGRLLAEALGMAEFSRPAGVLCALLYGLSSGAAATVLLIRMYALLTLWCVALLYLVLKKWREKSFDRHNGCLIAVTALGFWTQYFFLFYCIILAAVVGVLLLFQKRIREFWCLARSLAIAAAVGLAVFPFAIADVFASGRGVEALDNLSQGLSGYGERIAAFWGILLERTLSAGFWLLTAAVLIVWLLMKVRRRADMPQKSAGAADAEEGKTVEKGVYAAIVLLPAAGYFLLAARMSPYLVDRYIMPLFPFAALAGGILLTGALSALSGLRRKGAEAGPDVSADGGKAGSRDMSRLCVCAVCTLAAVLQAAALAGYDGEYLYLGYRSQENAAAAHAGEACVCVYDGVRYYENLNEFMYYDKTLLLTKTELENRKDTESIRELGRFVLLIKGGVSAEQVLAVFAEKYGFAPQEQFVGEDSVYGDCIYLMGLPR